MQTNVLLSIKPEFAEDILNGQKQFEFRRVIFKAKKVSKIVIYASSPVQRVIGEFEVGGILALSRKELWRQTKTRAGIRKIYFDQYFRGCETAFAIKVKSPRRYARPRKLELVCGSKIPPQSFRYLNSN